MSNEPGLAARLTEFAASLRAAGAIRSATVESAFTKVPRHRFLPRFRYRADEYRIQPGKVPPGQVLDLIYANNALITRTGQDGDPPSSSSAPSIMAKMLEAARLEPGIRVLEIGAGTGYNAALISHITGSAVVTVDVGRGTAAEAAAAIQDIGLAGQVHVIHGDGYDGHVDGGPYDRIIVTCGIAGIPPGWLTQLADDALIIAPVAHAGVHPVMAIRRRPDTALASRILLWGDFMAAAGRLRPAGMFTLDPAVPVSATGARRLPAAGPVLSPDGYQALWCYLGTRDARITRAAPDSPVFDPATGMCALSDPDGGTAWIHQDGTLTLAGDHRLADTLTSLSREWDASGRPAVSHWHADWRRPETDADGLIVPCRWHAGQAPADD
jgi:protein-L-isoaspartate(D-aspartate) O-methyltransferase